MIVGSSIRHMVIKIMPAGTHQRRKQMLNTISAEAWDHVKKEYPEVWAFLVHASLKGELRSLQREPNPNDWQKRRLEELTDLFTSQYELAKEVGRHRKIDEGKI